MDFLLSAISRAHERFANLIIIRQFLQKTESLENWQTKETLIHCCIVEID